MRSILFSLPIFLLCCGAGYAQVPDGGDTTDLPPNPEDFKYESDLIGHYSHGWFPQAFPGHSLQYFGNAVFSDVYDVANNLRSASLRPTTVGFSWRNPYRGDEQDIKKPYKDDNEKEYPVTDYSEYGLSFTLNLPMPAILRLDGALRVMDGLLFSNDTTRSYLGLNGVPRPFKEISVVYLEEYRLAGSAGFDIPFYGVYLVSEVATISSVYYIHAAANADYALISRATQYTQIANAKSEIRYHNGADTVDLLDGVKLSGLNRLRTGIDVGLGWRFCVEGFALNFEMFANIPMSSVLNDADWKQVSGGFRIGLGYQWLPEDK